MGIVIIEPRSTDRWMFSWRSGRRGGRRGVVDGVVWWTAWWTADDDVCVCHEEKWTKQKELQAAAAEEL